MGGYYSYRMRSDLLQCMQCPDDFNFVSEGTTGERWELFKTSEERWTNLFCRGFSFLLIQKPSHETLLDLFNPAMKPAWMDVKQIFDDGHTIIYSLCANESGHSIQYRCVQINPPAWDVVKHNIHQSG